MEFIEADPLPIQCQQCADQDCDECRYMALRWVPTEESRLRLARIMAEKKQLLELKRKRLKEQRRHN